MVQQLVRIDTKHNIYSYYEGKNKVHEIISDKPLDMQYVEQFRTNARKMVQEIDEWDGNDPDGDLVA